MQLLIKFIFFSGIYFYICITQTLNMRTIKRVFTYRLICYTFLLFGITLVVESCAPKSQCGSRREHRVKTKRTMGVLNKMNY